MTRDETLVIELDLGAEPIAGRVLEAGSPARPFTGWMALVSAVEDARERRARGDVELAVAPTEVHLDRLR
jgi:hypothetical protein